VFVLDYQKISNLGKVIHISTLIHKKKEEKSSKKEERKSDDDELCSSTTNFQYTRSEMFIARRP